MKKILVIEDEIAINDLICMNLEIAGYQPVPFLDGAQFGRHLKEQDGYDLALLDIMLPGKDGFALLEELKAHRIPVIYLTAKGDLPSKVKGLRSGAEDYIVKPFEIIELLARVDVVLRRYHKTEETIAIAGLVIDTRSRKVTRDGAEIALTPKEYELLLLFVQNPNTALYRETIYERIWEKEFIYGSKTVDLHIQRLRRKAHLEKELLAVNKVGYRLEVKT